LRGGEYWLVMMKTCRENPNLLVLIKLTNKITTKMRRFVNNRGKIKRKGLTLRMRRGYTCSKSKKISKNEVTGFLAKEIIARHPPQSGSRIDFEYLS